ncbi:MAG: hypothetical protein ACT4RN_18675 [Pseudonocardia sp.]
MNRIVTTAALTVAGLALSTLVATAADAASCGGTAFGPPGGRGKVSQSRCSVIGYDDTAKISYRWSVGYPSNGRACVEGRGFVPLQGPTPSGRPPGYVEKWFSLGCGVRGGGAVPVGNQITTAKVRAESLTPPFVVPVRWSH